jgi:hypothetical protein
VTRVVVGLVNADSGGRAIPPAPVHG